MLYSREVAADQHRLRRTLNDLPGANPVLPTKGKFSL